jgi:hypothetical protein
VYFLVAEDGIRKENYFLAKRIFKIMQGESEITSSINDNEHIENHPGTMNFKKRLEEAQQIHRKNLMFALRMQEIQPYYKATDLTFLRPHKAKYSPRSATEHSHSINKTKFMKEFEHSLQVASEVSGSNSMENDNLDMNAYRYRQEKNGEHSQRPKNILLQYTKTQDSRIIDVVVMKEPFRDRYAIFGLDIDDNQRFELRLSSEDVSNILDGDILVTSVENVEVWLALLNKVRLQPVSAFTQMPFAGEDMAIILSSNYSFNFSQQSSTNQTSSNGPKNTNQEIESSDISVDGQKSRQVITPSIPQSLRPSFSRPRSTNNQSDSQKQEMTDNDVWQGDLADSLLVEPPSNSLEGINFEDLVSDPGTQEMLQAAEEVSQNESPRIPNPIITNNKKTVESNNQKPQKPKPPISSESNNNGNKNPRHKSMTVKTNSQQPSPRIQQRATVSSTGTSVDNANKKLHQELQSNVHNTSVVQSKASSIATHLTEENIVQKSSTPLLADKFRATSDVLPMNTEPLHVTSNELILLVEDVCESAVSQALGELGDVSISERLNEQQQAVESGDN